MNPKFLVFSVLALLCATAQPAFVIAQDAEQNAGQTKLDEATDAKLDAKTPADLGKVIELCEEAIELGLDEGGDSLAKSLLAATALQRAKLLASRIPQLANNPGALRRLRRQAMDDLEKATENEPTMAEPFIIIAQLEALPGGDIENARKALDKAIENYADEKDQQARAYLLRAALTQDNEKRLEDLAKAVEADPTNAQAWQAKIEMQMATGKLQEAVDDAEKLLKEDDSNMFALQAAIQGLLGLEKPDEAIEILTKRIENDPSDNVYYRVRARSYIIKESIENPEGDVNESELIDKALADLDKAIELSSSDFESLVMRGQIYYDKQETEKANRDIADALQIQPNSVQGVLMRSLVAAREERYSDAISDMEMLVRANPSDAGWVMQLASYYQMDNRPRRAIKLLDELVRRNKDEWRAMRLRGDAKLAISEHIAAIDDYEEAIRVLEADRTASDDIDYSGLLNNLAWVLATSPNDELRDGKRSVELGLKACEVTDYKAAHILSTLAAGYAETGDFKNARKWAAKAVEVGEQETPPNPQVDQLKEELESYKKDEPWREEQKTEENEKVLAPASETIDT